jgi:hypothetical protein
MARSMSSRRASDCGSVHGFRVLLNKVEDGGVGDESALDDFRHSRDDLVPGQGVQRIQVCQDCGRRVEGAHQVLAFGSVDAGLPAHGGVHHAKQAGRHVDDFDAAEPGGGNEAGKVGDGPSPDGDNRVGAREIVLPQDLPAEGGHLDVLAFFGVGNLRRQRGESGRRKLVTDGVAGEPEGAGMDDQDPPDPLTEQAGKVSEQSPPHHHVVVVGGGFAGDLDDC